MNPTCVHCGALLCARSPAPRRLCWPCHHEPGVRDRYPVLRTGPKRPGDAPAYAPARGREPTEEDLEATIREQLADPPAWFLRECERRAAAGRGPRVCRVVRCP